MAKETIVVLRDDLDGTVIEDGKGETIKFSVNNTSYTIDLSTENAVAFRNALQPYLDAAAKEVGSLPRERGASKTAKGSSNKDELQKIRQWAKDNGYEVSERGRVAQSIQDAYAAAN
jgi:hypothetical protein